MLSVWQDPFRARLVALLETALAQHCASSTTASSLEVELRLGTLCTATAISSNHADHISSSSTSSSTSSFAAFQRRYRYTLPTVTPVILSSRVHRMTGQRQYRFQSGIAAESFYRLHRQLLRDSHVVPPPPPQQGPNDTARQQTDDRQDRCLFSSEFLKSLCGASVRQHTAATLVMPSASTTLLRAHWPGPTTTSTSSSTVSSKREEVNNNVAGAKRGGGGGRVDAAQEQPSSFSMQYRAEFRPLAAVEETPLSSSSSSTPAREKDGGHGVESGTGSSASSSTAPRSKGFQLHHTLLKSAPLDRFDVFNPSSSSAQQSRPIHTLSSSAPTSTTASPTSLPPQEHLRFEMDYRCALSRETMVAASSSSALPPQSNNILLEDVAPTRLSYHQKKSISLSPLLSLEMTTVRSLPVASRFRLKEKLWLPEYVLQEAPVEYHVELEVHIAQVARWLSAETTTNKAVLATQRNLRSRSSHRLRCGTSAKRTAVEEKEMRRQKLLGDVAGDVLTVIQKILTF